MPNDFAYLALFAAPVVAYFLFRMFSPIVAAAVTLVAGYLLLPPRTEIDLPVLPPIDKFTVTVLSVLLFSAIALRTAAKQQERIDKGLFVRGTPYSVKSPPGWLPTSAIAKGLMALFILSALITTWANREPVAIGRDGIILPGYDLYSALSYTMLLSLNLLPLLIGRKLFAHPEGQKALLMVIAGSALAYSLLVLFEVRMSPQLNYWIYGFYSGSFQQTIRGDGFRPAVFVEHGLWLAIFNCMAILAAVGVYRSKAGSLNPKVWAAAAVWLFLVLILSRSLGAFMIALVLLPIAFFFTTRVQLLIAACIGLMALTYPVMRERGIVPVQLLSNIASVVDAERAQSFNFRLANEQDFLDHVHEKALTGWGAFDRNFIFNEDGFRVSTIDGYWIISFSQGGYLRYIGEYGLLTFAFFHILIRRRSLNIGPETAALALIMAANLVDMVPNGTQTALTWLIAGALLGRLEVLRTEEDAARTADAGEIRGGRMRHRAAGGARPPVAQPVAAKLSLAAQEAPRKHAHTSLESAIPNGRGDQYSRFTQVHSRKLKEDRPSAARQNFRRKTDR